jgi:hypothetical protein
LDITQCVSGLDNSWSDSSDTAFAFTKGKTGSGDLVLFHRFLFVVILSSVLFKSVLIILSLKRLLFPVRVPSLFCCGAAGVARASSA